MTVEKFTNEIKEVYAKYLPNSAINSYFSAHIFPCISVKPFLIASKDEAHGSIIQNDLLHISFRITRPNTRAMDDYTKETEITEDLSIECLYHSYLTKPTNPNMVYGSRKLKFRKTTGSPEKIIASLDRFFNQLLEALKDDVENNMITDDHIELVKQKIGVGA